MNNIDQINKTDTRNEPEIGRLVSFSFLVSLGLLLLNDFFLKQLYGNWITGKLSDFAGLFAFTFFFIALCPRHRQKIIIFVSVVFVYWKTEFSQPLIDLLHSLGIYLDRTVDLTDLIALPMIFLASVMFKKISPGQSSRMLSAALIFVSCFAFMATSYAKPLSPEQEVTWQRIKDLWPRKSQRFEFNDTFVKINRKKTSLKDALSKRSKNLDFEVSRPWETAPFFISVFMGRNYRIIHKDFSLCNPKWELMDRSDFDKSAEELKLAKHLPSLMYAEFSLNEMAGSTYINVQQIILCIQKSESARYPNEALVELKDFLLALPIEP
jgi:hypothetical protein